MPEDVLFDPPRAVEVWLDGGGWWPAQLSRWIWADGEWWGSVRFTVGVGSTHLRSLPGPRIREPLDEELRTLD